MDKGDVLGVALGLWCAATVGVAIAAPEVLYNVRDRLAEYPTTFGLVGFASVVALGVMAWFHTRGFQSRHTGSFPLDDLREFQPRTWKQRFLYPGVVLVVALVPGVVLDLWAR